MGILAAYPPATTFASLSCNIPLNAEIWIRFIRAARELLKFEIIDVLRPWEVIGGSISKINTSMNADLHSTDFDKLQFALT